MIEFKNVSKHFGPTQVLHNIDLNIAQGEVVVIIGPSGSGKSTLLRCINKLEEITSGDLIVDGLKVNDPKVDERLIRQEAGMVFQQFYLFPHLTALENVMFGPLRVRGANKEEAEKLARELLAKVGLAERAHHYPSELSGGQQQRVAIARALAVKPKMMLFDEPTSALDPELRHPVGGNFDPGVAAAEFDFHELEFRDVDVTALELLPVPEKVNVQFAVEEVKQIQFLASAGSGIALRAGSQSDFHLFPGVDDFPEAAGHVDKRLPLAVPGPVKVKSLSAVSRQKGKEPYAQLKAIRKAPNAWLPHSKAGGWCA